MRKDSSIETKLSTVKYRTDNVSHLGADESKCPECISKNCVYVCPADVWKVDEDGKLTIEYENCLECGACRIACPKDAIEWKHPKGGLGIIYKQS